MNRLIGLSLLFFTSFCFSSVELEAELSKHIFKVEERASQTHKEGFWVLEIKNFPNKDLKIPVELTQTKNCKGMSVMLMGGELSSVRHNQANLLTIMSLDSETYFLNLMRFSSSLYEGTISKIGTADFHPTTLTYQSGKSGFRSVDMKVELNGTPLELDNEWYLRHSLYASGKGNVVSHPFAKTELACYSVGEKDLYTAEIVLIDQPFLPQIYQKYNNPKEILLAYGFSGKVFRSTSSPLYLSIYEIDAKKGSAYSVDMAEVTNNN